MALPSAAAISQPRAWGYDGRLDDLLIRLAASPQEILSIVGEPPDAERVQTAATAEEFVAKDGQVFGRSDFTGGSGLFIAHRANGDERDSTRYYKTRGVQVREADGRVFLIPQPPYELIGEPLGNETSSYPSLVVMVFGSIMRPSNYADQDQIEIIHRPTNDEERYSTYETIGSVRYVNRLLQFGDSIYAACGGDGIWKRTRDENQVAPWSEWEKITENWYLSVWAAKGRLLGTKSSGAGLQLVVVDPDTGAETLLFSAPDQEHFSPPFSNGPFLDVIDAGPYILVSCYDGYIYGFQDVDGTLELYGQAKISNSEGPYTMAYHPSGMLAVFTHEPAQEEYDNNALYPLHFYIGEVSTSTGLIDNLQLIRTFEPSYFGAQVGKPIVIHSDMYFLASEKGPYPTPAGNGYYPDGQLWRYDISTGGLHQEYYLFGAYQLGDIVKVDGRIICGLGDGTLLPKASGQPFSGAKITFPYVDHFTASNKRWLDFTIDGEGFDTTDDTVQVWVASDQDAMLVDSYKGWTLVGSYGRSGSNTALNDPITLDLPPSRGLAVRLEFQISSGYDYESLDEYPRVYSIQLRSQVIDPDFIIDLPVNVSDRIEAPNREPFISPGWGREITSTLLSMKNSQAELELYEPPLIASGWIQAVSLPVKQIPQQGSATDVMIVRFRGQITSRGTTTKLRPPTIPLAFVMPAPVVVTGNADPQLSAVFWDWRVTTPYLYQA